MKQLKCISTFMIKAVEVTRGVDGVKSVKDDMRLK